MQCRTVRRAEAVGSTAAEYMTNVVAALLENNVVATSEFQALSKPARYCHATSRREFSFHLHVANLFGNIIGVKECRQLLWLRKTQPEPGSGVPVGSLSTL